MWIINKFLDVVGSFFFSIPDEVTNYENAGEDVRPWRIRENKDDE